MKTNQIVDFSRAHIRSPAGVLRVGMAGVAALFVSAVATSAAEGSEALDWPTYLHDNQRTGTYPEPLANRLHLQWVFEAPHPPREAWPGTAQSDWWRKRNSPEPPRITFDKAYPVVSAQGLAYFGSSSDDQVYCLDLTSGKLRWTYFAEAPIRLAPTVAGERVLFGSDDGRVYCVQHDSGELLWRTSLPQAERHRLPGNGRMISRYPVRTGVLVRGNTAYFSCGLFPKNAGAWHCSVDIRDGTLLDHKPLEASPQGYLEEREGQLFAPTGRDPAGAIVASVEGALAGSASPAALPDLSEYPYAVIRTPSQVVGGGDGRVALLGLKDGETIWQAPVDGQAWGLAMAQGRLLVSTDQGKIYCFGAEPPASVAKMGGAISITRSDVPAGDVAEAMVQALPHGKGYALVWHADADGGDLLRELVVRSGMQVVGVVDSDAAVEPLRRRLAREGLYGRAVVHQIADVDAVPYTPHTFNLLVAVGADRRIAPAPASLRSLLRPGGLAFDGPPASPPFTSPAPAGVGDWTHMYADAGNSACSDDTRVGAEFQLQWFGRPGPERMVDRHLRTSASLVKNGLLFIPGRNYAFGVDAWNGAILWERNIPGFQRVGALRDSGNMVATDDLLYCASGSDCLALDVRTGQEQFRVRLPSRFADSDYEWGYTAVQQDRLMGTAVKQGTVYRELSYGAIYEANYGDQTKIACSDALFAVQRKTGTHAWIHTPEGAIFNPSIALSDDAVYFIESRNPETLQTRPARMHYPVLLGAAGADLVCLDQSSGQLRWRAPLEALSDAQTMFLLYKKGKLVQVCSRNIIPEGAGQPTVHYDIRVRDAADGKMVWKDLRDTGVGPNKDHGEQDRHPVIMGDRLVVEPNMFDLHQGTHLGTFTRPGGGCGTISASANSVYFRASNPAAFNLLSGTSDRITSVSRPGCWINMIPAGGLLLIPESSSGCICNFAVQGSMAFAPLPTTP